MQPKFAKLRKHLEETTGKKWNFLSGKEFVENSEDSSGSNHGVKQHRVQPTISLGGKVLKGTNGN